jgi:hypothetical protein
MERRIAIIIVLASAFLALSFALGFILLSYAIVTLTVDLFCYSLLLMMVYPIKTLVTLSVLMILILSYKSVLKYIKK